MRTLEAQIIHIIPFKSVFEVLKEVLPEAVLEFIKEPIIKTDQTDKKTGNKKKKKKNDDGECDDDDVDQKYEGGIRVLSVNLTKTVMIYIKLDIREFSVFKCKKKHEIGIDLHTFFKLIKSVDKGDTLTLYFDDDNKQFLGLTTHNAEKNFTQHDKIKIMDLNRSFAKRPSVQRYDMSVTMPASDFHKLCRDMSNLSSKMEMTCTQTSIKFACEGDCVVREKIYYTAGIDKKNINIKPTSDSSPTILQGVYELSDLVLFNKCSSLCGDVEISMKNNNPLILKYIIGTVGKAMLCISPIDDEQFKKSDEQFDNSSLYDMIKYKDV